MRHSLLLTLAGPVAASLAFALLPARLAAQVPATPIAPVSAAVATASDTAAPQTAIPAPDLPGAPTTPAAEGPAAQSNDPEFRSALDRAIPLLPAAYATQPYRLRLHNLHTLEDIDIIYRVGDSYVPESVAKLNYFLRDHNTQDVVAYDPREFDLLHDILIRLGRSEATIDVVCGYRTAETNANLRAASNGVAEHSQHILGHAIDIQIPGSSTVQIRDAALALNEGGVGYYPKTHFVHVDVGAIRTWTYAPRRRGHLRHASRRHHAAAHRKIAHNVGA